MVEIPILEAMTQGHTRKEAFEMAADLIETLADKPGFKVDVIPKPAWPEPNRATALLSFENFLP